MIAKATGKGCQAHSDNSKTAKQRADLDAFLHDSVRREKDKHAVGHDAREIDWVEKEENVSDRGCSRDVWHTWRYGGTATACTNGEAKAALVRDRVSILVGGAQLGLVRAVWHNPRPDLGALDDVGVFQLNWKVCLDQKAGAAW